MKLFGTSILLAFAAAMVTETNAYSTPNSPRQNAIQTNPVADSASASASASVDRRQLLTTGTVTAIAGASSLLSSPNAANAAGAAGPSAFCGTYTDPINHPGGTRTISLLDTGSPSLGDYALAEVNGGGGRGEPASYVLPAAVLGDRTIVIDFSPKGGPRDFVGVLEKNGDIRFLKDGNVWPRQK